MVCFPTHLQQDSDDYVIADKISQGCLQVSLADRIHRQLQELAVEGISCLLLPKGPTPLLAKERAKDLSWASP